MLPVLAVFGLLLVVGCGRVESEIDAPAVVDAVVDAVVIDATVDAGPDAKPPTARFAIAYTNRWDVNVTTSIGASQIGLVVNESTTGQTMDLNTLQVISSSDDHPTINFNFTIANPAMYVLPPQQAGGLMVTANATYVNPLVPEPRFNTNRPTLDFSLNNIPQPIDVTVNASAVVRHGNQEATLTWVFTVRSTGSLGGIPTAATRISSVQM